MGMNLILRAKNANLEHEYRNSGKWLYLDRNYSTLIWGIESWGEDCEFNQLQKLFDIDLSPLRMFNYGGLGFNTQEIDGWKDWELSKVTTQLEIDRISSEYEEKLKNAIEQDSSELQNNWVETNLVKRTIFELIRKIQDQPEKLEQLRSHYFKPMNYEINKIHHEPNKYYILNDFEHIIDFIDFVESRGETKMSFYER